MERGNTKSNTDPDPATRQHMRVEHGIGWHPRGGWCRKFPGDANRTYFGRVAPGEAVRLMLAEQERRERGEAEMDRLARLTVRDAAALFLRHVDVRYAEGRLGNSQRAKYGREIEYFRDFVGGSTRLRALCEMSAPDKYFRPLRTAVLQRGVFACEKQVVNVRSFLRWCSNVRRFMPPPFYADAFDIPDAKERRAARKADHEGKAAAYWQPAEVREIVDAARQISPHFHAHVLLVLNGGLGATDLSNLTEADIDWQRRCIHTDRNKNLVPRVVPLWDRTVAAMQASRAERPEPADPQWRGRFFLTRHGRPLVTERLSPDRKSALTTDAVRNAFYRLLNAPAKKRGGKPGPRLHHLKRHRGGFYSLRSVFATLSLGHGGDRNLEAIIMGQTLHRDILEYYVRDVQLDKLRVLAHHVESQIWPDQP